MPDRKNLLFITTDQQRFDSLPCYGADFVVAPNLERLAAEGTVFESCYVSSPVCVPCRATMMTGMFPSAHGAMDNFTWIDTEAPKWTDAARAMGYTTAAIGKMHFAPWDAMEGFDERIICEDKRHWYLPDDHSAFMAGHGIQRPHPTEVPGYFESCGAPSFPYDKELYADAYIGDKAAEWIRGRADTAGGQPFAAWVSFTGPHDPYDPPPEYSALYEDSAIPEPIPAPENVSLASSFAAQQKAHPAISNSMFRLDYTQASKDQVMDWRRHYFGNITLIDEGIGKILAALEAGDQLDNTVIVFSSDHGDALGDHGMVFKGFFYESMVHVPLIVRDGADHRRVNALVGTADIVAYFYDILGASHPPSMQGTSIAPLLDGSESSLHDHVFSEMPARRMVFDGRYKYVHSRNDADEFYDLRDDPNESVNLIGEAKHASVVESLRHELMQHLIDSNLAHSKARRRDAYPPRRDMEARYRDEILKGST